MKKLLAAALVFGGMLGGMSATAEAGGPIFRPGGPVRDIAQPFSTRRGRELQAARNQRNASRFYYGTRSTSSGYRPLYINRTPAYWPGLYRGPVIRYRIR